MKIEFSGRVVAGFLLGGICGAVATGILAVGPIQRDRDNARFTIEQQKAQVQQLQETVTAQQRQLATQSQPAPPQDPAVQVLNAVRPGLGTAAGALVTAAQKAQANKAAAAAVQCPAGSTPQTSPNWQGARCVATDPAAGAPPAPALQR
jgi:hypothetical protein